MAALAGGLKKFGQLHGVINTAGVGNPRRVISSTGTVHSLKDFRWIVDINLIGTFNVLRLAAAVMAKQAPEQNERGVIINVASVAAFDGQIGQAAYSASKAAVVGMALPIAREFAELGIRVVTVAPGLFGMFSDTCLLTEIHWQNHVVICRSIIVDRYSHDETIASKGPRQLGQASAVSTTSGRSRGICAIHGSYCGEPVFEWYLRCSSV